MSLFLMGKKRNRSSNSGLALKKALCQLCNRAWLDDNELRLFADQFTNFGRTPA
jgi:hypothetical protein